MKDDLRQLLEQLFSESVVLLQSQTGAWSTGFFVSEDGLLCTTYHGVAAVHGAVEISWRGQRFPAALQTELSSSKLDFALLRINPADLGIAASAPVPILPTTLAMDEVAAQIAAIVYTPCDEYAPPRLRILDGTSLSMEQYRTGEPNLLRPIIETLDVMSGPGASGSPVIDLRRFRVIGYVQGRVQGVTERLGRVAPLDCLLERLPNLQSSWNVACERFDRAKRAYFQRPGQTLPPSLATPADLTELARQHNQKLLETLRRAGIYNDELFLPRNIAQRLDAFIAAASAPVAILTGEAGTDKTNLLTSLALQREENVTPLLVTGAALDHADTLAKLPEQLGFAGSLEEFALCLQRSRYRLLVILDGYNEWPAASRVHLIQLVRFLGKLSQAAGLPVQTIIGVKLEFLREHAHELIVPSEQASALPLHLLHAEESPDRKPRVRHYIQVPFLCDAATATRDSEQAAMYEHFRALAKMRDAAGNEVGIRPQASYDELSDALRAFLDRPLLLRQFMMRYHDQPAPIGIVRSALYREVLRPHISSAVPQWLTREAIEVLLGNRSGRTSATCADTLVAVANRGADLRVERATRCNGRRTESDRAAPPQSKSTAPESLHSVARAAFDEQPHARGAIAGGARRTVFSI